jgi:hypothetical protein
MTRFSEVGARGRLDLAAALCDQVQERKGVLRGGREMYEVVSRSSPFGADSDAGRAALWKHPRAIVPTNDGSVGVRACATLLPPIVFSGVALAGTNVLILRYSFGCGPASCAHRGGTMIRYRDLPFCQWSGLFQTSSCQHGSIRSTKPSGALLCTVSGFLL